MRTGFTTDETYDMFAEVSGPAYDSVHFEGHRPSVTITPLWDGMLNGADRRVFAYTDFEPIDVKYGLLFKACDIVINTLALPFLGEDELKEIIIHECAHVVSGYWAAHGPAWADKHVDMGGVSVNPILSIRDHSGFYDALGIIDTTINRIPSLPLSVVRGSIDTKN